MTTPSLSTQATFRKLLRSWRQSQGLSQKDFGELLDPKVHCSTVSCWENDVRRPLLKHLAQIITITGIPASLALGIEEDGQA